MSRKKTADRELSRMPEIREGAADMRSRIFVGTSGWAYPSWKPEFYPQALPRKKFLEYYVSQLNSLEVNYTFRRLPSERMVAGWLGASGAGFRFSFKAPQRITHFLRLAECSEAMAALSDALAPVVAAGKMGIVLFQLPPNFKASVTCLDAFLLGASRWGVRLAFEFRHSTWFCDEVYAVLRRHHVALCVAESDELQTPDVVTAPFTYYRFRKSEYSEAQLAMIADRLRTRSAEGDVFAYFKHEEQPTGAIRALKTLERLKHA
jgi:uncharacterized protein YecE (DUF72 family)